MHSARDPHPSEPSKRRGAASIPLFVLVLVVAALIVAAIAWLGPRREPRVATGATPPSPAQPVHVTPLTRPSPEPPRQPPTADREPPALGPARFQGLGRIRGEVAVPAYVAFPLDWFLVIEPSPHLLGAERAESRRVDLHAGVRLFDMQDLPLGGYRVRGEAEGLNCLPVDVLLVAGSEEVWVTLQFTSAGILDGRVLAADGSPADGFEIVLESLLTRVRSVTKADANGQYVFKGVIDGEYKLFFGAPDSPLVPPGDLVVRAPSLRFKDVTLPPTGAIALETRAASGAPIAGVEVSGFGDRGGVVRVRTDFAGRARVPWLPPGDYRLEGATEDGRRGRVNVTVVPGADGPAVMHLE